MRTAQSLGRQEQFTWERASSSALNPVVPGRDQNGVGSPEGEGV
jgi:hypothetical protein